MKAQLKCPQGHVRVSHARRKRRDIRSRGDTVFRGIQSRQRTTRSSLYLKVGGMWESRKRGGTTHRSRVFVDDRQSLKYASRYKELSYRKMRNTVRQDLALSSQTDEKSYKTITLLPILFSTTHRNTDCTVSIFFIKEVWGERNTSFQSLPLYST